MMPLLDPKKNRMSLAERQASEDAASSPTDTESQETLRAQALAELRDEVASGKPSPVDPAQGQSFKLANRIKQRGASDIGPILAQIQKYAEQARGSRK